MKKILLLLFITFTFQVKFVYAEENRLILSDDGVNETLLRDDFTYVYLDSLFINREKLYLLMERLEQQMYRSPVNATLDDSWAIIPEKTGQTLDRYSFMRFFYEFFYSDVSYEMKVPKKDILKCTLCQGHYKKD